VNAAFVAADAHGRLDLVEGLLRQEGLIDEQGRRLRPEVLTVQLGDLCNCVADSIDADLACLKRAPDLFDVYLVGNHEHPYFGGTPFYGFWSDPEVGLMLRRFSSDRFLRPAIAVAGVLVSHAGLTSEHGWGWHDAAAVEAHLASAWTLTPTAPIFSAIGPGRGGFQRSGGILWADWSEPKRSTFRQLVGHTPGSAHRRRRGSVCIDLGARKGRIGGAWIAGDGAITPTGYVSPRTAAA
jgi:hypothetical protein